MARYGSKPKDGRGGEKNSRRAPHTFRAYGESKDNYPLLKNKNHFEMTSDVIFRATVQIRLSPLCNSTDKNLMYRVWAFSSSFLSKPHPYLFILLMS